MNRDQAVRNATTYGEYVIRVECPRCAGKGYIRAFGHVDGGRCFECLGSGGIESTVEHEARLQKARERAEARRAEKARIEEAERVAKNTAAREIFEAAHPDLVAWVADRNAAIPSDYDEAMIRRDKQSKGDAILDDLAAQAWIRGMSDKQADLIRKILREQADLATVIADTPDLIEGRRVVEGVVLSTKMVESDYGTSFKMLVQEDCGTKVYGTIPRSIDPNKGDRVRFTATVERSRDDRIFGFASRPTKAEVISV